MAINAVAMKPGNSRIVDVVAVITVWDCFSNPFFQHFLFPVLLIAFDSLLIIRGSQIKEVVWCTWHPWKRWYCHRRWWGWLSGWVNTQWSINDSACICMRILLSFVSSVGDFVLTKCFKTEDEVRDAVLVTDGDSEMGQVCLP